MQDPYVEEGTDQDRREEVSLSSLSQGGMMEKILETGIEMKNKEYQLKEKIYLGIVRLLDRFRLIENKWRNKS